MTRLIGRSQDTDHPVGLTSHLFHKTCPLDYALKTGKSLKGALETNWEENQRIQKPESFGLGPVYSFAQGHSLAKYYGTEDDPDPILTSRLLKNAHFPR